jgi:hypothetical protein
MLPKRDGDALERLLEELLEDDSSDIIVLGGPGPKPFRWCCTYSYGPYH